MAVVDSIEQGNKYHKHLKNGQIAVTKEGSLWRWDGLVILNGKKTFTFKRIESTNKIFELEKLLSVENKKLETILNKVIKYKNIIEKENKSLKKLEEKNILLNSNLQQSYTKLNEADKEIFIERNNSINNKNEIVKLEKKLMEFKNNFEESSGEIKNLETYISQKSSIILKLRKEISENQIDFDNNKKQLDQLQISFAIEKQKEDTIKLMYSKSVEEIKETEKKIVVTKGTIVTLISDHKEVKEKIKALEAKPIDSQQKLYSLNKKILSNKKAIETLKKQIENSNIKINNLSDNNNNYKKKLEEIKEICIRKDTQIIELSHFLQTKSDQIKNDFNINTDSISKEIISSTKFDINTKESEVFLRRLKSKNDEFNNVNLSAEEDATELEKEVESLGVEEKDLTRAAKKLEKAIEELNKESRSRIINSFEEINNTFTKLFKKLFNGGKAYLELVDSSDPLEAGLELMISPPGKKLQKLSLLSGGEKALASLALIFSTFINKASPICILDEVDAPLDEANVEKFCELLKEAVNITKKRFLIVTHNRITMGYMNKLYGITMIEPGSSKIVSVDLDQAESVYAAE